MTNPSGFAPTLFTIHYSLFTRAVYSPPSGDRKKMFGWFIAKNIQLL